MGWLTDLYETYENCSFAVGTNASSGKTLLPVAHSTALAHLEISIDCNGNYLRGMTKILSDYREQLTVIPVTEDSGARTGLIPHPLFDNLKYVAGDYTAYGGDEKTSGCYSMYMAQLNKWCDSEYSHPAVCIVRDYLKRGCLISDLVADGVLYTTRNGKLLEKWDGDKDKTPPLFKLKVNPYDLFVRFRIYNNIDKTESRLWLDRGLWKNHTDYYISRMTEREYCYVLGKKIPPSRKHPNKIRWAGDKAKIISGNDSSDFTYRGRFAEPGQAASIGYETSQKAHNALKWLIANYGYKTGRAGDQTVYIAWSLKGRKLPAFYTDTHDLIGETGETAAGPGFCNQIEADTGVVLMGLDSATQGRLSIIYYKSMKEPEYIANILFWHKTCSWRHRKKTGEKGRRPVYTDFEGAPSLDQITFSAYGSDETAKKSAVRRLIPCIADRAPIPYEIISALANRASDPAVSENYEYRGILTAACALIRKYHNDIININNSDGDYKEVWTMALNTESDDRNYLFGRLLAYTQYVENCSQIISGESSHETNAERLGQQFALRPAKTYLILWNRLTYHFNNIEASGLADELKSEMNAIVERIGEEHFNDGKLSELYLLGYASQLSVLRNEKKLPETIKSAV
jgi:CRISPR-associated protein Csd1